MTMRRLTLKLERGSWDRQEWEGRGWGAATWPGQEGALPRGPRCLVGWISPPELLVCLELLP